ncbi:MAG: FAD-dependent oxidoreductase [Siculibacillus sp.]|nr:FAD-dependent oxidoreductase [Siculibacillus sp.]
MIVALEALSPDAAYDLVVVGSGAAGLAAALFAALEGGRVLIVERTEFVGGTTALSAGTTWVPGTRHAATVAAEDDRATASRFLDGVVGDHAPRPLREAFLDAGPAAIERLERETLVHFRPYATHPDYEQQVEGATLRGRALEPLPFDGRRLGPLLHRIRPPIPEFTLFGGMMVDRTDVGHLLKIGRSLRSTAHAAAILARYGLDRSRGPRGTRLVMGNALVGRFLASLATRRVDLLVETEVDRLETGATGIEALVLRRGDTTRKVATRLGVVDAAGGFNRHPTRRAELLPAPVPDWSPAAPGHTGAMQDLALGLGARFSTAQAQPAFWAPVSLRRRGDGTMAVFPHFVLDRSKPGTVCVDGGGRRFVDEAISYHRFGEAMFAGHAIRPTIPCLIVTDATGLRRYGLGQVRMGTRDLSGPIADGYLIEGASLAELAAKAGVPAEALAASVAEINAAAASGVDPALGRGATAYERHNGDSAHPGPNPTLGEIVTPPFYAVRLHVGDIGAAAGLVIDASARVLDGDDRPIPGLWACGNEAASIMGGTYPGPGITIGPAIVFAHLAVADAFGRRAREVGR